MSARIIQRPLTELPTILLPAIVLLNSGRAVVLTALGRKNATVVIPESGKGAIEIPLAHLARDYTGYSICVKPEYRATDLDAGVSKNAIDNNHWFWSAVLPLWRTYAQVFAAAFLINCLVLALALFIMNFYDLVLPNKSFTTIWVLAIGMGFAIVYY